MADNIVIGAGRLYVATLDGDGDPGPERYLGDSVGASLTGGEGERLQVFAGDGADSSRKLVDKLLDVSRSMSLTLHDLSLDNIALFVMGEKKSSGAVAAVAPATPEQFPACKAGDEFQLGTYVSGAPVGGYKSIDAPSSTTNKTGYVAGASGNAPAVDDKVLFEPVMADWIELTDDETGRHTAAGKDGFDAGGAPAAPELVVFLDTARVRVLKAQATGFRLSYTPIATAFDYVESSSEPLEGAVRYVEHDPREGTGRNIYMTKATITPNGEWPLKSRTNEQTLGLSCEALGKVFVSPGVTA